MTSSLTATSLRSGFLYFILLIMVVLGVLFLLFLKQPSSIDNLNRQAFRLNYAAFENGIRLAHYRYIIFKSNAANRFKQLNIWQDGELGLDFNIQGYPIGVNITEVLKDTRMTADNCLSVWQFVLGPLQPAIHINRQPQGYWVELDINQNCIYQTNNLSDFKIIYDPKLGKTSLISL